MMKQLAKLGFTQSYTYFTWRNTKPELTDYLTELTQRPGARLSCGPNFFANTPDINPVLPADAAAAPASGSASCSPRRSAATTASTAASSCARRRRCPARRSMSIPRSTSSRPWDWDRPGNIRDDIRRINALRRDIAGAAAVRQSARSTTPGTTTSSITARRRPTAADFLLVRRQPRSAQCRRARTSRCRCGSSALPTTPRSRSRIWSPAHRFTWTRQGAAHAARSRAIGPT